MSSTPLKSVTQPAGFRAAGGAFGIKKSGNPDMALIAADVPCAVAVVLTTNLVPAEAVRVAREHAAGGVCRAIVCNSGNANAATGKRGLANARAICARVAGLLGCKATEVLATSTGIIGVQLPMEKINRGIDELTTRLHRGDTADAQAARAIMTTDLVPKGAVRRAKIGGKTVTLGGISKGSGMIAPNMATMKAFITTDAAISPAMLRAALLQAVNADGSFNRISVDQHMSPSDMVVVLASGLSGQAKITKKGGAFDAFVAALTALCQDLSYQIVQDGEGATRVIRVRVTGAASDKDALNIARAVANSPLIKCAVHGGDPNWGRIVTAAGYAGAKVDPVKMSLKLGKVAVYRKGAPANFDRKKAESAMSGKEVLMDLSLGLGKGRCEFLTCDLSAAYVSINADYHT